MPIDGREPIPPELRYSPDHEWAYDEGGLVRIGITQFAQDALGDVVFVSPPQVGITVNAGEPIGELESTKSVADLVAPVSGVIETINERLDQEPELINSDPYGDGWIALIRPEDGRWPEGLLDAPAYGVLTGGGDSSAS
jgi:glycine cleavage system H protein